MDIRQKIKGSLEELAQAVEIAKISGHNIILTSGCFDLIHGGHLEYLCAGAQMGFLVVGVNSDAFVKRLKGNSRPIRSQADRAFVLAGFEAVRLVAVFDSDYELIKAVRPDIYMASATSKIRIWDDIERIEILNQINAGITELESQKQDSTTDIIRRATVCEY